MINIAVVVPDIVRSPDPESAVPEVEQEVCATAYTPKETNATKIKFSLFIDVQIYALYYRISQKVT